MKILGISFSPRKNGNTETLMNEALSGAKQEGAEVELYRFAEHDIKTCDGCRVCWETGECHIADELEELCEKMLEADGIIFGTPVYFYSMNGQAKTFMDRTSVFSRPEKSLANKVGGVIVTAGSMGLVDVLKDFYFYIVTRQMIPANFVAAYAGAGGDAGKLEKCIKAAKDMGRQMVLIAQKKFEYPPKIRRASIAYGTHTK